MPGARLLGQPVRFDERSAGHGGEIQALAGREGYYVDPFLATAAAETVAALRMVEYHTRYPMAIDRAAGK